MTGPRTTREVLEAAIRNTPDDRAAHAAYADLLMEEGDPRGEFMQVQLALEDESLPSGERARLTGRERQLLDAHERDWLGPLAPILLDQSALDEWARRNPEYPEFQNKHTWRRGVLSALHLGLCPTEVAEALRESTERLPCLRELRIVRVPTEDVDGMTYAFDPLRDWPLLPQIRVFQVGLTEDEDYGQCVEFSSCVNGDDCGWLVDQLTEVEELYLFARHLDPDFGLPKPRLRFLQYYHGSYYKVGQALADNSSLVNLTHLLIHPHEGDADSRSFPVEDFEALVRSPHLPRLAHLRLRLHLLGDRACPVLAESGILRQLKTLDLRHGMITDVGARTLADCPDLRGLELLDVSRNALTAEGIALLSQTGVHVEAGFQGTSQGEYHDYLYQGDQE
jgi:uncharacterized protein (TIGR02996 family)